MIKHLALTLALLTGTISYAAQPTQAPKKPITVDRLIEIAGIVPTLPWEIGKYAEAQQCTNLSEAREAILRVLEQKRTDLLRARRWLRELLVTITPADRAELQATFNMTLEQAIENAERNKLRVEKAIQDLIDLDI